MSRATFPRPIPEGRLDAMGFGWDEGTVWVPRVFHPTRDAARTWYANFIGCKWVEVRVLARWARFAPELAPDDAPEGWWAECARDVPGAFPVWRCE